MVMPEMILKCKICGTSQESNGCNVVCTKCNNAGVCNFILTGYPKSLEGNE